MKNTAIDEVTLMILNSLEVEVKKLLKERDELKEKHEITLHNLNTVADAFNKVQAERDEQQGRLNDAIEGIQDAISEIDSLGATDWQASLNLSNSLKETLKSINS